MSDILRAEIDELSARAAAFGIVGGPPIFHLQEAQLHWLRSETLKAEHHIALAAESMLQELARK